MKFYNIALACIIFNLIGVAFTQAGVFTDMGFTETLDFDENMISDSAAMEEAAQEAAAPSEFTGDDPTSQALGIMYSLPFKVARAIFNPIKKYVMFPALLMTMFNVPAPLPLYITVIFNLIQLFGLMQFITGRGFGQYE